MGLDIRVYKNLQEVKNPKVDEDGYPMSFNEWTPGWGMKWSEKHFPGRGEGVDPDKVYTSEEEWGFRAGSYSGYNLWRRMLEDFSGGEGFMELIEFADNEGVIGPVVSKKLYEDFLRHEDAAKEFAGEEDEWWFRLYLDWKKAFKMASENGAVEFC